MHSIRKSTSTINQTTHIITDDILENKLELKNLSVVVDNHLTLSNHIAEKAWSLYGQPLVMQTLIKLKISRNQYKLDYAEILVTLDLPAMAY